MAKIACEAPVSYHGRPYGDGEKIPAWHTGSVLWMTFAKRVFGSGGCKR